MWNDFFNIGMKLFRILLFAKRLRTDAKEIISNAKCFP